MCYRLSVLAFSIENRERENTPFPLCLSKPCGIPRRKWETNITIVPEEMGYETVDGFSWLRIQFSGRIL
jgi:hypothetical protein